MRVGALTTSAPGVDADMILSGPYLVQVGSISVRVSFKVNVEYISRFYAIAINGIIQTVIYVDSTDWIETSCLFSPSSTTISCEIIDCGKWPSVPDKIPSFLVEIEKSADTISWIWSSPSPQSQANGHISVDNSTSEQLSEIVVNGAIRGYNCSIISCLSHRGVLRYTLNMDSGSLLLTWYNVNIIVAQGQVNSSGDCNCSSVNSSGLTISCVVDYDHDVDFIDNQIINLIWPDSYQIHYTKSTLVFPRNPERTLSDNATNDYSFLSPALSPGTYHAAIVPVKDGVPQLDSISVNTIVINIYPDAPVILEPLGDASVTTIRIADNSDSDISYMVYYSGLTGSINFGHHLYPAPILIPAGSNSAVLDPVPLSDLPGSIRYVIRASLNGYQETHDTEYTIEYDINGNIVRPRPCSAIVTSISLDGLMATFGVRILEREYDVLAKYIDLYVFVKSDSYVFDASAIVESKACGGLIDGIVNCQFITSVASSGWYDFIFRTRSEAGTMDSDDSFIVNRIFLCAEEPAAVSAVACNVMRGKYIR